MNKTIEKLKRELEKEEAKQEAANGRKKFLCACKSMHSINQCFAIQTHWYVRPHGCTGGDYWNSGELQIICPKTGIRNRLLYDSYYKVEWNKRHDHDYSADIQFKYQYKHLFKKVIDEYDRDGNYKFYNNYYIDNNHKKFGIKIKAYETFD